MELDFTSSIVPPGALNRYKKRLEPELQALARAKGYDDSRGSINCCDDQAAISEVVRLQGELGKVSHVVLCGIGGSSLGTVAVYDAIIGKGDLGLSPTFDCVETVDSDMVRRAADRLEAALKEKKKVLLVFISKSGKTTEAAANWQVLVDIFSAYDSGYAKQVVVITGKGSLLWNLAKEQGFCVLEIPPAVGGRYSVFSAVGLFPLAVLGVDIRALCEGARTMRDRCLGEFTENPAAKSAAVLHYHLTKGATIHDTFLFSVDLESLGKWYRQLMAESIGKDCTLDGKPAHLGMTPTVSIGSVDLHSVAQLYLAGPFDKVTTFVSVPPKASIHVPVNASYSHLVDDIQGKSLSEIMAAILGGVHEAYRKADRPFVHCALEEKAEAELGAFMQMKMIETMFLAWLLNVNPFDQPKVESYKKETRRILSQKVS